jgi:arginyl-tRNA synthetase
MERRIKEIISDAITKCRGDNSLTFDGDVSDVEVTKPKTDSHGDYATNVALALAAKAGMKPREVADIILSHIDNSTAEILKVEVAGPGFINIFVDPKCYTSRLAEIYSAGESYGRGSLGKGKRVQVEFVSANPTGPLHIGHGRGAVYGDVLGNVLAAAGYEVSKEYYVNDAGNQIRTLGRSVYIRYRELLGNKCNFPEDCYQGEYIVDIAREIEDMRGAELMGMDCDGAIEICGNYAAKKILAEIKEDLAETGVVHDFYFHENLLHTDAAVEHGISWLRERGHVYDKDGAIWFKTTDFGDDKDRVLKKSDGSLTYLAADVAYHKNKYDRGFDKVIDVWGADHGGYVARIKAAVTALGHDPESFHAVLIQLVNLMKGGKPVSMSTRSATYETLEDVRKQVGRDVCRYFFLMRSHNAQLDFDLELAMKETPDNPVFYIQYAHARICSIFKKAEERGISASSASDIDLNQLDLPEEHRLARMLIGYPQVVKECAETLEPHKLAFYLIELSRMFQSYYSKGNKDDCYRIVTDDGLRSAAKLYLLKNIRIVIVNALGILGISAPTEMSRQDYEEDGNV